MEDKATYRREEGHDFCQEPDAPDAVLRRPEMRNIWPKELETKVHPKVRNHREGPC